MTSGRFLAIFAVFLGVLYSLLSYLTRVGEIGAGMAFCVFGTVILGGFLGSSFLFVRRK